MANNKTNRQIFMFLSAMLFSRVRAVTNRKNALHNTNMIRILGRLVTFLLCALLCYRPFLAYINNAGMEFSSKNNISEISSFPYPLISISMQFFTMNYVTCPLFLSIEDLHSLLFVLLSFFSFNLLHIMLCK